MENSKLALGIILFLIGAIGVLSLLTMDLTSTIPPEMLEQALKSVTIEQLQWLSLTNPTILLALFVVAGTLLHDKVGLEVPCIDKMIQNKPWAGIFSGQLKTGVIGGLAVGAIMVLISAFFMPHLPADFIEAGEKLQLTIAARFLYGGLTEEILMRYGLMTFIVWLGFKMTKQLTDNVYWSGIILGAILFGAGHLPLAFSLSASPSTLLIVYIILGNTVGGLVFGWMYWKKGLEAAIIAHIFAHVAMMGGERVLGL